MRAVYRGHLATVTECMGNPRPPSDRSVLPPVLRHLGIDPAEADPPLDHPAWDLAILAYDSDGVVLDQELWVSLMDPDLVEDPTDSQVAAARARG